MFNGISAACCRPSDKTYRSTLAARCSYGIKRKTALGAADFAVMEVAAINEHEGFVRGGPERIKLQHEWVEIYNEICEEIESRGDEALQRYVPLLAAEHPAVRLAAALGLLKTAPNLAVPVLEDLRVGMYGGGIASDAGMTLDAMRKLGEIPTSN